MREENTASGDALIRLEFYERELEWARTRVTNAEERLKDERAAYAVARPLTESERAELAERIATGGALCCSDGLTWLMERLPEPWASAINRWAYEHMGCSPSEKARMMYVERILALKLDWLPSEDE